MMNLQKNKHLLALINKMEARPQMYLGKKSISLLYVYISAFNHGLNINESSKDDNLYWYFNSWIANKYKKYSMGWLGIILEEIEDEEMACERFFVEFKEYINDAKSWKAMDVLIKCLKSRFRDLAEANTKNLFFDIEYYPNKYADNTYEKSCYALSLSYGSNYHRITWKYFYIDKELEYVWVDLKSNEDVKIKIEEFLESEEYKKFTIKDIARDYQEEI